jgi:uncharacterized protein (DUF58 family)
MLPIPTTRARAAFVGCAGMWLVGLLSHSWAATAFASGTAMLLVAMLAATVPIGRRVRAQRLEFAWWLSQREGLMSGAVVPHMPFQVRCYVRHRGTTPLELSRIEPILADSAEVQDVNPARVPVPPRARTEFAFTMSTKAAGRVVLHGLAVSLRGPLGLFEVPLYFPNTLAIKVLPRTSLLRGSKSNVLTGLPLDRPGRHRMRRRGGGTDLHELRDFQPGDPFKSIAWKASARAGQLLVREVDQEVQQTLVLILDVSGSMRGGSLGQRKLDTVLELAVSLAHAWLDRGDRVGLMTVDGRLLANVAPGEGAAHLLRLYDALLAATEVVDADLTAVDDSAVLNIVARYVRHQDGVEFPEPRARGWDMAALARHVRSLSTPRSAELPQAQSPAGAELRRFCRERGIALPHRATPLHGDKARGLSAALRLAGGRTRAPLSVMLVSDLDGVVDYEPLCAVARLLTRRSHTLSVLVPEAAGEVDGRGAESVASAAREHVEARAGVREHNQDDALGRDLASIYRRAEQRRVREARGYFGRFGVPVNLFGPTRAYPGATQRGAASIRVA